MALSKWLRNQDSRNSSPHLRLDFFEMSTLGRPRWSGTTTAWLLWSTSRSTCRWQNWLRQSEIALFKFAIARDCRSMSETWPICARRFGFGSSYFLFYFKFRWARWVLTTHKVASQQLRIYRRLQEATQPGCGHPPLKAFNTFYWLITLRIRCPSSMNASCWLLHQICYSNSWAETQAAKAMRSQRV